MLEGGAVAPLLEGLKHKKYEVRSASVFALGVCPCLPLVRRVPSGPAFFWSCALELEHAVWNGFLQM
jgi:hypothetical protein